jgi:hypothetical protein
MSRKRSLLFLKELPTEQAGRYAKLKQVKRAHSESLHFSLTSTSGEKAEQAL